MEMTSYQAERSSVTMDGEIKKVQELFEKVSDPRASNTVHRLSDVLMSGFAMFSLKYPSLLRFDEQTVLERENLKEVYGIDTVCSDTTLRRVLDRQSPEVLRQSFADRFADLERTGLLRDYHYQIGLQNYLISSCDGVQHFSSKAIHCSCCLRRAHRDGSVTYHHNMLCAALVHPDKREVFLMGCEPIMRQDGVQKDDCELNAVKRLLDFMANDYSAFEQYNFLFVEDALYANASHIQQLQSNGYSYIINVKPDRHKTLFTHVAGRRQRKQINETVRHENGVQHRFEWVNDVVLYDAHPDMRVNFLHYVQTDKKGQVKTFTWITDIKLNKVRVWQIMRAGRARWKIENETFNTLKNLGYHFEHNYGHGEDHLSTTLAYLMLLAFYVDQFVQACSHVFQQIEEKIRTKVRLWEAIKAVFQTMRCPSMDFIYRQVAALFKIKLE